MNQESQGKGLDGKRIGPWKGGYREAFGLITPNPKLKLLRNILLVR